MNYGLYLSASGALTSMYRQDVFSNNLANVETVGFKPDVASVRQRDPESIEDGYRPEVAQALLDRLGGGVLAGPQRISFNAAPLRETGNPLDVALDSDDTFFAVSHADADGQRSVRLTRAGQFTRNAEGYLVTTAGGHRVLDPQDNPIQIASAAPVRIDSEGRVLQFDEPVAQIQVAKVADTGVLVKQGQNLFRWAGEADPRTEAVLPQVRQGYLETSGTDPILTLMKLVEASRAANSNLNMVRYHDQIMDRAISLGRVA